MVFREKSLRILKLNKSLFVSLLALLLPFQFALSSNTINDSASVIDTLISRAERGDKEITSIEYCDLATHYLYQDSFNKAMTYAEITEKIAKKEGEYYSLARQYVVQGQVYLRYGAYVNSVDNFSKAERIAEDNDYPIILINAYYGIGRVHNELGEFDKALEILKTALKIAEEKGGAIDEAMLYNAIGSTYQGKGEYEKSIMFFEKYYQIAEHLKDSVGMVYALINLGESDRMQGKYSNAIRDYERAEKLNKLVKDEQANAAIYGNLALVYYSKNKLNKARTYFLKSIAISSNSTGMSVYLLQDLQSLAQIYAELNQYDSSYFYYKKYADLSDSLAEIDYLEKTNKISSGYQIREKENKEKIVEQKLFRRTIIIGFFTLLSALIIILIFITYSRYKIKTAKLKADVDSLNLRVDQKNRELVSSLIDQMVQQKVEKEVEQVLIDLEGETDVEFLKQRLQQLLIKLSKITKSNHQWDSFKLHFERVHPDFFKKLKFYILFLYLQSLCLYHILI